MGNKGFIKFYLLNQLQYKVSELHTRNLITSAFLCFCGLMVIEKDISGCLCVAHVFGHVLKYLKSTK